MKRRWGREKPIASMSSCARERSGTSSRAARWMRSTSGSSWKRQTITGRVIFWSGSGRRRWERAGRKGRAFLPFAADRRHGNPINKRNAWSTRSLVYVRLIPPGAADTVHYRLTDSRRTPAGKIHLKARLHYRKFAWWNTQFAFAGERVRRERQPRRQTTTMAVGCSPAIRPRCPGKIKAIPDLPIITLAEDTATLTCDAGSCRRTAPAVAKSNPDDWTRWNDYGIGLLLQGDLKEPRRHSPG